jgi:hypothetical protein
MCRRATIAGRWGLAFIESLCRRVSLPSRWQPLGAIADAFGLDPRAGAIRRALSTRGRAGTVRRARAGAIRRALSTGPSWSRPRRPSWSCPPRAAPGPSWRHPPELSAVPELELSAARSTGAELALSAWSSRRCSPCPVMMAGVHRSCSANRTAGSTRSGAGSARR